MSQEIQNVIQTAFTNLWADVISIIPSLIAALVIFVFGILIATIVAKLARKLVHLLQVDALANRMHVHDTLKKVGLSFTFSDVIGTVVKWFFIVVFLNASVEILGWTQIIQFLNDVLRYIPQVLIAVIILAIGLIVAAFVENTVVRGLTTANTPVKSPATLGGVAKWAIVSFAVMAAVSQLGIAENLIAILFAGVLLVFVISFGLAGKEKASEFLDKVL